MEEKLKTYLEKHKINYIIHEHHAVFTVEESTKIKQSIPGLSAKCLFLKDSKNDKFYLVCMPALKRLDIKKLSRIFGAKKLNFGSQEELKKELSITPGSVSIFCMINANNVELIVDQEIWNAKITGFHPNINTATLEITHENLEKFYDSIKSKKQILEL